MTTPSPGSDIPQDDALRMQLAMIAGNDPSLHLALGGGEPPPGNYFELRGLHPTTGTVSSRVFIPVADVKRVMDTIRAWSKYLNVFIGCAPRTSTTSGTLQDIDRVSCLWVDCDTPEAAERLRRIRPAPSIVVASGGPGRFQGFWQISSSMDTTATDRANRRLRLALGSDRVCDATRVLRPIGSLNHKYGPPAPVVCVRLELDCYTVEQVTDGLPEDDRYKPKSSSHTLKHKRCVTTPPGGAFDGLLRTVATAPAGQMNNTLYWAARRAKEQDALPALRQQLTAAAETAGLPYHRIKSTLDSAERAA